MAYGIELILGFTAESFERVCGELGLPAINLDADAEEDNIEQFDDLAIPLNHRLREAHYKACCDMGWAPANPKASAGKKKSGYADEGRFSKFITPQGSREFSPFSLGLEYQPGEMGDTRETAVLGVSLSGRYFPTFLDWRDPHGTLSPVIFNESLNAAIKIARTRIEEVMPIFSEAILVVKEIHY